MARENAGASLCRDTVVLGHIRGKGGIRSPLILPFIFQSEKLSPRKSQNELITESSWKLTLLFYYLPRCLYCSGDTGKDMSEEWLG